MTSQDCTHETGVLFWTVILVAATVGALIGWAATRR